MNSLQPSKMTTCLGTGSVGVTSEMVELSGGFVILLLCVIVLIFLVKSKSLVTGTFFSDDQPIPKYLETILSKHALKQDNALLYNFHLYIYSFLCPVKLKKNRKTKLHSVTTK